MPEESTPCPKVSQCAAQMRREPGVIIMGILALLVVGGGMAFMMIFPDRDSSNLQLMMMLVLGFYFGTSISSARKDKIISNQLKEEK